MWLVVHNVVVVIVGGDCGWYCIVVVFVGGDVNFANNVIYLLICFPLKITR